LSQQASNPVLFQAISDLSIVEFKQILADIPQNVLIDLIPIQFHRSNSLSFPPF